MVISFELLDDEEKFETAEGIIDDGYDLYTLKGDEGAYTVRVYGLKAVLSTAHNDKHRRELRCRFLSSIYESISRDGADNGVIEPSNASLSEIVSMKF